MHQHQHLGVVDAAQRKPEKIADADVDRHLHAVQGTTQDDALIGVKSTALLFGARTRFALMVFYGLAVVLIGAALTLASVRWPAWIGLAAFAAHLVWQIGRLAIGDPALCLRLFKSNRDAGLLLFAGLLADAAMKAGA